MKCFWGLESIKLGLMRSVLPRREAHSCKPKDPHPPHLPGAVCLCSPDMCCPWTRKPSDAHLDKSQQKEKISVEKLQSKMRIWTSWLDHYCPLLGDGERRDDSNGLGFFSNWNHLFLSFVTTKHVRHSESAAWDKTLYEFLNVSYCRRCEGGCWAVNGGMNQQHVQWAGVVEKA